MAAMLIILIKIMIAAILMIHIVMIVVITVSYNRTSFSSFFLILAIILPLVEAAECVGVIVHPVRTDVGKHHPVVAYIHPTQFQSQ